jgi:mRNA interferase MazF
VSIPRRGEIWWAKADDKRRPVLVVTRSEAVQVLSGIVVAPFDNLQRIRRSALAERVGDIGPRRPEICVALHSLADC